ncbi:MAG: ABC transporter substrate-binding protein [Oscillospiraceae bacterium]
MKKIIALTLTATLMVSLTACGTKEDDQPKEEKTKIGILQLLEHPAMDMAKEGFIKALEENGYAQGENLEIDFQNAQNDQSNLYTMSQRLVGDKNSLVLAIGTGAAQSLASLTKEMPIVITAVTDPVDAGVVTSLEIPGTNVTGTTDAAPIKEQIELLAQLTENCKKIGVLYTSSEDNSVLQARQAKEIINGLGYEYVEQTITSAGDVQQATQSLVDKCDGIYIPTDNTLAAAMALVGNIVKESKTPVVCGDTSMTLTGGLATLGLNYYNLGYQTGEIAMRILKGEDPSKIAVEAQKSYDYVVSKEMAQALDIKIPTELEKYVQ